MSLLAGARVLDVSTSAAGMYATRHLADLGAAVTRLDADPAGDRRWQLRNRGKHIVAATSGRGDPLAHVVVVDRPMDEDDLRRRWAIGNDALIVHITGRGGPGEPLPPSYAISALGGLSGICGIEHPVTPEPVLAAQLAALFAATAATAWLAGVRSVRRIEVVAEECVASCLESALPIWFVSGVAVRRRPDLHDLAWPARCYRTGDGWVGITAGRVEDAAKVLELVGLGRLVDPSVTSMEQLIPKVDRLEPELSAAFLSWRTDDLTQAGQAAGLAIAPALWPADLHDDPHVVARGFSRAVQGGRELGFPAVVDGDRPDGPTRVATPDRPLVDLPPETAPAGVRPLDGVRIVDLTWALAGPFVTMMLADLGADVVKLESEAHVDSSRLVGPYVGPHDHDHSGYFRFFNRQKRSVRCDFNTDADRQVLLELVAHGDAVAENFRAGMVDRKGLGYEALAAVRPSLVMCSLSGFGRTGPRRDWRSYGAGMAETHSGLAAAAGGEHPIVPGRAFADCIAGLYGGLTVCAQLYAQRWQERGSYSDVAQFEACAATVDELAVAGPDPEEAHTIEGSDREGWQVVGRAGSWPVPTLDAVAAQGLADGFCTEWPHPDGGVEAYAVFPARFDGERYEITRPAPDLGEHLASEVLADWTDERRERPIGASAR